METLREIGARILGKLDHPTDCVTSLDADQLRAALAAGDTTYLVHAVCHGSIQGEVFFHTAEEACAFRDECIASESTRYTRDVADAAFMTQEDAAPYKALRDDFNQRHPWKRFSRGVRFIARSAPIGRPVKEKP